MEWKFRGMDLKSKWVSGDLIHLGDIVSIKDNRGEGHLVKGDTVQLWTGMRDYSGKDLYDGDVFLSVSRYMVCVWREDCLCFCFTELKRLKVKVEGRKDVYSSCCWETPFEGYPICRIVGNIHVDGYGKMMEKYYGRK